MIRSGVCVTRLRNRAYPDIHDALVILVIVGMLKHGRLRPIDLLWWEEFFRAQFRLNTDSTTHFLILREKHYFRVDFLVISTNRPIRHGLRLLINCIKRNGLITAANRFTRKLLIFVTDLLRFKVWTFLNLVDWFCIGHSLYLVVFWVGRALLVWVTA